MPQPITEKKKDYAWIFYAIILAFGVIYIYFTITTPTTASSERLGLVGLKKLIVQITFILPYIATWLFGTIAVVNLRRAQMRVQNTIVRSAYGHFAFGIACLVSAMILAAIMGQLRSYYQDNTSFVMFVTILNNYIWALLPLFGFILLYRGARNLIVESGKRFLDLDIMSIAVTLLLGTAYSFLVFTNSSRQVSLDPSIPATYYLPDVLIFVTIIVPILATWFFGIRTAFMLEKIDFEGKIQSDFARFENGIWLIIFALIILQAIISLGTERFYQIGLGPTLGLLYMFLIILVIGYSLLARVAKKL